MTNSSLNPDSPVKEFTGVWIPAEIMECDDLNLTEKFIYAQIASFRICYASNKWLGERVGKSDMTARRAVSKLVKMGFIVNVGTEANRQLIVSRGCSNLNGGVFKNEQGGCSKMNTEYKEEIKEENNRKNEEESSEASPAFGNSDINELFAYWKEKTELEPNPSQINRNACSTLIKRAKGTDGAKRIVDIVAEAMNSGDTYAPQIASFVEMFGKYEKLSKLIAWKKRQNRKPFDTMKLYANRATTEREIGDDERARVSEQIRIAREKLAEKGIVRPH